MTVKQLIAMLLTFPPDAEIGILDSNDWISEIEDVRLVTSFDCTGKDTEGTETVALVLGSDTLGSTDPNQIA